jgi:branched-chain amino acid transport system permease protein
VTRFVQLVIDGIATGSIYALVALALVLIFRSTGLVNLAQGEMAMFSTFVAWQLNQWGLNIWLALIITMTVSMIAGMVIQQIVIRPVQHASELTIVIVTLGLFLAFNSLAGWIWGYVLKAFPDPFPSRIWEIGDVRVTASTLGTIAVMLVLAGALFVLFQFTKVGLAMRAVAYNVESSQLVGIRVNQMLMLGWGLAAALGAAAGVFVAPKLFLDPNLMAGVLIYAIAAAAVGGLDSPVGAVVGGIGIGVVENLAGSYIGFIGTDLKILVPLAMIVVILLLRPQGLFGSRQVLRV